MEQPANIQTIRGFPFPNASWFLKENIESTLDYTPEDGDVIVASYPKTGTTWLQYIVLQIASRGKEFPSFQDVLYKVVPFMEMAGAEAIRALTPPRIYKHHYPYDMVKKNDKAKVLYIYRNPADTFVSYYHFMRELGVGQDDFDTYFEEFVRGDVAYGPMFEHVKSYLEHEGDGNLLLLSYEKLLQDRRAGVLRIAEFLGEEYHRDLLEDPELLEGILERTSFEYMKRHLSLEHPGDAGKTVNFFRKGKAGDGKRALSAEQRTRLQEVTAEVMAGTSVLQEWTESVN